MKTRSSHRSIAAHLRTRIVDGAFRRGDKLPSFEQLHRQFGVSSRTVCKALGQLEIDGLIERRPRSGVYVAYDGSVNRTRSVALVGAITEGLLSDYWMRFLAGVQTAMRKYGMELVMPSSIDNINRTENMGLLAFGDQAHFALPFVRAGVPVVSVGIPVPGIVSVALNEYEAGLVAAQHLVDLGHERIAYLTWENSPIDRMRVAGYEQALHIAGVERGDWLRHIEFPRQGPLGPANMGVKNIEARIAHDTDLVSRLNYPIGASFTDRMLGRYNMTYWLEDGFESLKCTAIIAQNDYYASGVIDAFHDHGIRVPEEISVVGFDNERELALFDPSITSVGGDMFDLGIKAVDALVLQWSSEPSADVTTLLPVTLYSRASTSQAINSQKTT